MRADVQLYDVGGVPVLRAAVLGSKRDRGGLLRVLHPVVRFIARHAGTALSAIGAAPAVPNHPQSDGGGVGGGGSGDRGAGCEPAQSGSWGRTAAHSGAGAASVEFDDNGNGRFMSAMQEQGSTEVAVAAAQPTTAQGRVLVVDDDGVCAAADVFTAICAVWECVGAIIVYLTC